MNPPRKKMYHPVKRAIPSYNLTNRTKRTLWFSYWEKMKSDIHAAVQSQVLDGEIENTGDKVFTGIIARLQWPIDNVVTDEVWAYHIATIGDAMRDRKV